jgi:predicted SAM-dependent methyltransferase
LIYGSHVFEHLLDARDDLNRMFDLLKPGGRLVLIYPNRDSLVARMYGKYAPTWDPPRHIILPSASAMRDILSDVGFIDVTVETAVRGSRYLAASARAAMESFEPESRHVMIPNWVIGLAEQLAPTYWGWGDEILAVARRPAPGSAS